MRSWHCQPNSLWFQAQWKERDINDQTALRRCSFLSIVEWYHKFLAGDQTRHQITVVCSAHFLSPSLSLYKPTIMDSSSTSFLPRSCLKSTALGKKKPVFVMNLPKSDEMDKKNSSNHKTIPRSSLRSSSRPRRRGLGFGLFQGNDNKNNNAAVLMINKDPSMRSLSSETLATADSYSSASAGVNRYSEKFRRRRQSKFEWRFLAYHKWPWFQCQFLYLPFLFVTHVDKQQKDGTLLVPRHSRR